MKKILAILVVSMMLLGILTGCSAGKLVGELESALSGAISGLSSDLDFSEDEEPEESVSEPEESVSEPEESVSDSSEDEPVEISGDSETGTTRYDPSYLEWDQDDWKNATAAQKRECALAYLMYVAEKMGQGDVVKPEMFESELDEMAETLEVLFGTMELTGFKNLREATDFGMDNLSSDGE